MEAVASTRATTLTTSTPTSPRTLSSQASSGTLGLTWDRYSCLLDIYDYLRLIRFIPIFSLDLEILLKFFDGLSRQIFVRFRLISLGGWLGLISDLRCLDSRFTLSRSILLLWKDISIFCEDWPEPDKLVLTALQFSNINIFIRNFCHPRLPKNLQMFPRAILVLDLKPHHQGALQGWEQRLLGLLQLLRWRGVLSSAQHGPGRRHARYKETFWRTCLSLLSWFLLRNSWHFYRWSAPIYANLQCQSLRILNLTWNDNKNPPKSVYPKIESGRRR